MPGTRRYVIPLLVVFALVGVVWAVIAVQGLEPRLGLDLRGGSSVTFVPTNPRGGEPTQEQLDTTVDIIRNRVNSKGVAEAEVNLEGGNIVVSIPNVSNPDEVIAAVGLALWGWRLPDLDLTNQWYFIVLAGFGIGLLLGPASTDAVNRAPRTSYGEVTGVTQDERVVGGQPDAKQAGRPGRVYLRAERRRRGNGRVYRIAFTASDGNGGSCTGTATVSVPLHKHRPAVDSAPPSHDSFGG